MPCSDHHPPKDDLDHALCRARIAAFEAEDWRRWGELNGWYWRRIMARGAAFHAQQVLEHVDQKLWDALADVPPLALLP